MTALEEALVCLAQEPWCFHPDQVARLTDRQILDWYIRPAAERARALAREQKGLPPEPKAAPAVEPGPPPRAAVVGVMHHVLGLSVAEANAAYDRQLREWESQQGAPNGQV